MRESERGQIHFQGNHYDDHCPGNCTMVVVESRQWMDVPQVTMEERLSL